jgi:hypothetical protein
MKPESEQVDKVYEKVIDEYMAFLVEHRKPDLEVSYNLFDISVVSTDPGHEISRTLVSKG